MSTLYLASTERSPEVSFDFAKNVFTLKGESYPEDVKEFYGPVIEQLEAHLDSLQGADVSFTFEFVYFNSSTAKVLMGLFELLDATAARGNKVKVVWAFEADDDNMEELGEEFGEDLEHAVFELTAL